MVKDFLFSSEIRSLDKLSDIKSKSIIFLFQNGKILVLNDNIGQNSSSFLFETNSPSWNQKILPLLQKLSTNSWNCISFGEYLGKPAYLLFFHSHQNDKAQNESNISIEGNILYESPIRNLFQLDPGVNLLIAGIAYQIYTWLSNHVYCGKCGDKMSASRSDFALTCSTCHQTEYPQISPAVIIAIIKDDKILLAHNKQFPTKLYSVIAGFVNPGENLEEAISREVKEEIGITITNISYFASQPWPFPNSLMLAFTADWAAGEISVDNKEIGDAQWFGIDHFPKLPSSISVARKLIEHFVHTQSPSSPK